MLAGNYKKMSQKRLSCKGVVLHLPFTHKILIITTNRVFFIQFPEFTEKLAQNILCYAVRDSRKLRDLLSLVFP